MDSGMQITINVKPGATNKDIAAQLRFQAGLIEGMEPKKAASRENTDEDKAASETKQTETRPIKTKTVVKTKAAAAPKADEEDFDLEADQDSGDDFELGDDDGESKAPEATKEDVIKALQAYVRKNNDRDKAIAIIKKFAKSGAVKDLTLDQYPKVLKALGA